MISTTTITLITMTLTRYVLQCLLQVFVTVKATNGAGASTTATSNGVYLSYLSQGLSPPGPVVVWDTDSVEGDL